MAQCRIMTTGSAHETESSALSSTARNRTRGTPLAQWFPVNFPIAFANDEVIGKGRVGDISMAGCTVQTDAQMALGAIFQLSLGVPDAVSIDAARARNVQLDRVGLEFLKFQKSERERLQNLVRGLLFARLGEKKAMFDETPASAEGTFQDNESEGPSERVGHARAAK